MVLGYALAPPRVNYQSTVLRKISSPFVPVSWRFTLVYRRFLVPAERIMVVRGSIVLKVHH